MRRRLPKSRTPGLFFGEQESAKIAGELLDARTHGYEIVVRAEIAQLGLDESFLQADVGIEAVDPLAGIDVYDAALSGLQEVQVDLWGDAHAENRPGENWCRHGRDQRQNANFE